MNFSNSSSAVSLIVVSLEEKKKKAVKLKSVWKGARLEGWPASQLAACSYLSEIYCPSEEGWGGNLSN